MIKEYRVWDKVNKKYLQRVEASLCFYSDGVGMHLASFNEMSPNWDGNADDIFEVEAFTGVLDVTKTKVFEGDIVSVPHKPSNNPLHPEWDNLEAFRFTATLKNGDAFKYVGKESMRIIGSIKENPDIAPKNH
jgi:hypothetical protein